MNEEARKKLYSQLIQMSESNMKEDAQSIISEEEFNAMSDKEILKYVFEYRDNQTYFEVDGKECIAYIELPDMNLEGQDLSDVHLSKFMLGEVEENDGYYKISRVSSVNLKDTNAIIDLSKIQPNKVSEEYNIKEFSIDFTGSNFNGCDIYGMLPDEYSQGGMYGRLTKEISVIGKQEALDEKYLQRRKEHHLSEQDKKISDRAYERIINGESLKGMRGVNKKIDLTDYDFSEIEEYEKLVMDMIDYNIEILNTGIDKEKLKEYLIDIIEKNILFMQKFESSYYHDSDYYKEDYEKVRKYIKIFKDFKIDYLSNMSIDEMKKEIIKKAYKQDNIEYIEYIEKYFNKLSICEKNELLELAYNQGYIEFVEKNFRYAEYSIKEKLIKKHYEQDDIDFLEEHFESVEVEMQKELIKKHYEKGDVDFIRKHFSQVVRKYSHEIEVIKLACKYGDIDLVAKKRCFGMLDTSGMLEIINFLYEQNDINFIRQIQIFDKSESYLKLYIEVLTQDEELNEKLADNVQFDKLKSCDRFKITKLKYEKGDIEFVEKYFEKLGEEYKREIVETAYKQNDIDFVEKHFYYASNEIKNQVLKMNYKNGNIDFVEKYFEKICSVWNKEILELAYEQKDMNFIRNIFNRVDISFKKYIVELTQDEELGKKLVDSVDSVQFKKLDRNSKESIIQMKYRQGDIEFVKQRFNEGDNSLKEYIAKCTKEPEFVKYFVDKEKDKVITQGKKEVSASGLMLEEELNMSESELDVDYIKALIDAGINVDFKSYKNVDRSSPEYTPMLYKALQIKDDEKRRAVVESMLRAGVDVTAKYKKIDYYWDGSKETKEVSCLDANDGELVQIMQELGIGMSTKETPNVVHQVQDNKEVVTDFLRSTVRLTDEEIRELENLMSGFGRDLYQESVDNNLQAKKDILDACNATKQGFTKEARILTNDVKILYARLKFFIENQINIIPDRLNTTLGISRKAFDKNYGKYLVEDLEIDDDNYSGQVKKSLLSKYPMPQTREELLKELEMLINKGMGEI